LTPASPKRKEEDKGSDYQTPLYHPANEAAAPTIQKSKTSGKLKGGWAPIAKLCRCRIVSSGNITIEGYRDEGKGLISSTLIFYTSVFNIAR